MQRVYPGLTTLFVLFFIAGCNQPATTPAQLQKEYQEAIEKSMNPTVQDIYTNLTAINSRNKDLIRDTLNRIKVVTWTDWSGYQKKVQDTMKLTRKIWVTVAPKMQSACSSLKKSQNKAMRIRQWLGMPPDTKYTHFVEMYVHPEDMFRPCPDPDIADRECELTFPDGLYVTTDSSYRNVYIDLKAGTKGYPLTGLGYTYDWGNPKSNVGFSEFIVNDGAVIYVNDFVPTDTYCR